MAKLSWQDYDRFESEGSRHLCNREIEAFQPMTFLKLGYPSRVSSETELFRYVDVMHEGRFDGDFTGLLAGITREELDLLVKLNRAVLDFSVSSFDKPQIARNASLRSLHVYRQLRCLIGDQKPRVFEIGPGCGYLAALFMLSGYEYAATEITQALYLYQNRFWDFLMQGRLIDFADGQTQGTFSNVLLKNAPIHIPWWKFLELRTSLAPEFDIITCNHAWCEMHPSSLRFTLKVAQQMLRGAPTELKAIVFEGWGWDIFHSNESIARAMYESGFVLVHHDPLVSVLVPSQSQFAVGGMPLPFAPQPGGERSCFDPFKYQFPFHPPQNPVSQALLHGRASLEPLKTVQKEELLGAYAALSGKIPKRTRDEEFMDFVNEVQS